MLKYIWPSLNKVERNQQFEWRYLKNPYQNDVYVYLALDGNKVIGFRGLTLQLFKLGDKTFKVFSPADSITHPDFQRLGIMSKLTIVSIDAVNNSFPDEIIILLNTTTSSISMPLYLKQNWQKINNIKKFAYKFSILNYVKNKINAESVHGMIRPKILKKRGYEIESTKELKIKEILIFTQENRNYRKLMNIQDELFYSWIYSHQSEKYTFLYCKKGSLLNGYLIIKQHSKIQYWLVEYNAIDSSIFQLMIIVAMRQLTIPLIRAMELTKTDKTLLNKSGFISESEKVLKFLGKKRFPFLVRSSISKTMDKDFFVEGVDIRMIDNWHVNLSDCH